MCRQAAELVKNLRSVFDHGGNTIFVQFTLGKRMVGLYLFGSDPHVDRDVRVFGDLVVPRTGDTVKDGQRCMLDTMLLFESNQFGFRRVGIIRQENHESGHVLVFVFCDLLVNLLDQTGQVVVE